MNFLKKIQNIFVDSNNQEIKKIKVLVERINGLEADLIKLSDNELRSKTFELKEQIRKGKTLDEILPGAFAVCREGAKRAIGQRAFDAQIMGGIGLHQGKITEMKTGEGKTLAAVFAVYLNALEGRGVHIITVNDYLARRDTNWMGAVYSFLGLSVGCVQHDTAYLYSSLVKSDQEEVSIEYDNLRAVPRGEAYAADITYGTNNEFGFDYLRDNMVLDLAQMVQVRDLGLLKEEEEKRQKKDEKKEGFFKKDYLNFAIVDEVDSILIDEARTPLIISAADEESNKLYLKFAKVVPILIPEKDYNLDEKMQAVSLSESGMEKIEKKLGISNMYAAENMRFVHHLNQALKAHAIFKRDKQYVVQEGEVIIVDDFTGRLMPGRRFSEGLHQALEAKEGVAIQKESRTLATITFQNYFRLYKKLAGMTGTAMTSAEELFKVYKLDVLSIPTNRPMVRQDFSDKIYKSEHGKMEAIAKEIKKRNKKGQPVLVGTISVEKSEELAEYLLREGLDYEILNAKNHEKEALIIAKAGEKGAITLATNMAGRGTDIKLEEGVASLGGLHIIGTERHEARRIDDQLRGRAGRQGDPGSSQFYVSLEDELMKRFGSEKIKQMMDALGLPEDQPIQNKIVNRSIESAQKKIEGFNFDIRKHVLEYDDVINRQREVVYQKRRENLLGLLQKEDVLGMIKEVVGRVVKAHTLGEEERSWNLGEIKENCRAVFNAKEDLEEKLEKIFNDSHFSGEEKIKEIKKTINDYVLSLYKEKEEKFGASVFRSLERVIILKNSDLLWMEHLDNMQHLREGIGLRGYGQRDPLVEYKKDGFEMFQNFFSSVLFSSVEALFKTEIMVKGKEEEEKNILPPPSKLELKGVPGKDTAEAASVNVGANFTPKVSRNSPCPCGSGKKYKKCCGKKQ
jgi:preprotein translocase subunit SecA